MSAGYAPGSVKVTKGAVHDRYPDLDARIAAHIQNWRDSVAVGTTVSVADMMNFAAPGRHNMPVEIVLDHLFPVNGKCQVKGVEGVVSHPSSEEAEWGYAPLKFVTRTA
ncbi:hypothetical protein ACFW2V_12230 [Streptomyces sp. NPDC058947]|uniref:hypothetical protein n=1 Tax=Streptomyces sp. NPDC058947 TaxID=3346675 RepID=UPI003681EB6C